MKKLFNRLVNKNIETEAQLTDQSGDSEISNDIKIKKPDETCLQNWIVQLLNIENALKDLIKKTEPQFLALGNDLYGFVQKSNEITEKSTESANALSGDEIGEATYDLEDMFDRISSYLQYCDNELAHNFEILSGVLNTTGDVDSPLEGFNKIVKKLHMLGVTTRIENARSIDFEGSNFEILSHDVLRMSGEINQKSIGIKNGVNTLFNYSENNLTHIKLQNEQRGEQAQQIVKNMQSCLNTLKETHNLSSKTAHSISVQSQDISSKINHIVMSMQFHDICRQRIEHVIETLQEQRILLESAIQDPKKQLIDFASLQKFGQTCSLQQIQLSETEKNMVIAVEEVVDNLAGVYEDVVNEAMLAEKMVSKSDNDNKCSLDEMENGIRNVENMLNANVGLGIAINDVIHEIAKMVDQVSHYVVDINFVGSEIELIAMNGLISAAHMGDRGAALSIVADEIHSLSSNAREQIKVVSAVLERIGQSTKDLRFGLVNDNDKAGIENVVELMVTDLDGFINTFKHVTVSVMKKLNEVHQITNPFKTSLQNAIDNIHAHDDFSSTIKMCSQMFQLILDELSEYIDDESSNLFDSLLDDLEDKYTMDDEREVHESFLQNECQANNVDLFSDHVLENEEVTENELGNNVELF